MCPVYTIYHISSTGTKSGLSPRTLYELAGIPVEVKSSECLIRMKYRIIILIIIIISLGQMGQIFYRIMQTHHACTHARAYTHTRVHACARTRAHTCPHTQPSPPSPPSPSAAQAIAIRCRPTVTVRSACDNADRWLFK